MMDEQRLQEIMGYSYETDWVRDCIEALIAEVRRLRAHNHELAEMLAGRTTVEAFTAKHGMFDLTIGDMGAQIIAQSMIQLFKTGGATNFLTFKAMTLEGDYSFTIQKATGITPEEKYAQMCVTLSEAESALTSARAALQAAWDLADHINCCRECGDMSWETCDTGSELHATAAALRQAALGLTPDREGR